jgi:hypothetical protein
MLQDIAGTVVTSQSTGSVSTKGGAVSKTVLRSKSSITTFPRKQVGLSEIPRKQVGLSEIALLLCSLDSPRVASVPRALCPRLRTSPRERTPMKNDRHGRRQDMLPIRCQRVQDYRHAGSHQYWEFQKVVRDGTCSGYGDGSAALYCDP